MKKFGYAMMSIMLALALLLPTGNMARASGTLQIIAPYAAGTASGSNTFPLQYAFDSTDMSVNAVTGEPTGGPGASFAPYYTSRVGYIDFGPDWANIRIVSTWTKYRTFSNGDQAPYEELWWDDDNDKTNDSGLTETRINFNSAQGLATGGTAPWIRDADVSASPVVPEGRYLLLRSSATMTNRASEYAIVGWVNKPVTGITVTGAGGADTIATYHGTLQMSADIVPVDATEQAVAWTAENGTGSATISPSGLLTAVSNGTVTVRATAQDGSGVSGTKTVTISNQVNYGTEGLQVITPVASGTASGSNVFSLLTAFDGQPDLDENTGGPAGGVAAGNAPYYSDRYGYIDFGPDWNKVHILSTWTQYRVSSSGDQSPYQELWWDNDSNKTNDSGLTETRINFNTAQGLSTGGTTPWIKDSDVSSNPVVPQARYLILHSAAAMTNRAMEYAFIGWIDANGNGVQEAPYRPVTQINVTSAGDATSVLTNETLQMSANVLPFTANNKSYVWSVVNGTGSATISAGGLLTAVSDGTVTVKATAQDGSGVVGSMVIDVSKYRQFILPVQGNTSIYYKDIQASFPQIDWQTLERLYIPAGNYQYALIGNLPQRSANNPLIITNYGGQVKVSGTNSYTFAIGGGSNWVLTGKYDSNLKTGNVNYPGHQNGNFANSAGTYGIEIGRSNTTGLSVGGYATNFELSFIEIGYSGFAGLQMKTDNQPTATMDGVKVHDLYIHDTESEGMYIGNTGGTDTQHKFTNLEIYNNRVLRTGTEGIQLSNMGGGLHVHNNVVAMCATDWKDPFQAYQDGCFQYAQRSGSAEIDHNIFIGGASKTFEFWMSAATGETLNPNDEVWI
ncbi:MAG: Ig-like domain-containing protein, partial [Paenibacillaceae bacterium]|nr:Ig-like domain-containing protein [Paenibacillaceae bacterium]